MNGLKKIALVILSPLLFLSVLEGICLVIEKWSDHDRFIPVTQGFTKKENGELRIFAYGGSTIQGDPLPAIGFMAQIEYFLKKQYPSRKINIVNYGQRGFNSSRVVKKMVTTIDNQPDAIIVLTAHNEYFSKISDEELAAIHALQANLNRFALIRALQRLINKYYLTQRSAYIMGENLPRFNRESERFLEKKDIYRKNIGIIVKLAQRQNIPLILCTAPANLLDWPPVKKHNASPDYQKAIEQAEHLVSSSNPEKAVGFMEKKLSDYPDDASLLYYYGRALYNCGRYQDALQNLRRAKDLDPIPWRVLSIFNDIVRTASKEDNCFLADIEHVFEKSADHSLVDFNLISDNCHPTPLGSHLIAKEVANKLREAGVIGMEPVTQFTLNEFLQHVGYFDVKNDLNVSYLLANARYCMKAPWFNYSKSEQYFKQALLIAPERFDIWANLASISFFEGKIEQGKAQLEKAIALKPKLARLDNKYFIPYLREALKVADLRLEDFMH